MGVPVLSLGVVEVLSEASWTLLGAVGRDWSLRGLMSIRGLLLMLKRTSPGSCML